MNNWTTWDRNNTGENTVYIRNKSTTYIYSTSQRELCACNNQQISSETPPKRFTHNKAITRTSQHIPSHIRWQLLNRPVRKGYYCYGQAGFLGTGSLFSPTSSPVIQHNPWNNKKWASFQNLSLDYFSIHEPSRKKMASNCVPIEIPIYSTLLMIIVAVKKNESDTYREFLVGALVIPSQKMTTAISRLSLRQS